MSEIDRLTGLTVENYGDIPVLNPEAVRGHVFGVAFDFDDTITVLNGYPTDEFPYGQYSLRDGVARIIEHLKVKGLRVAILTSATTGWVKDSLARYDTSNLATDIDIFSTRDPNYQTGLKRLGKRLRLPILPYTKIPIMANCNVLVDDHPFTQFDIDGKLAVQLKYALIDARGLNKGLEEEQLREALGSLGAL
ncbi:hypothetical protein A2210_00290 [Candidatus Woesebacteria bacterium RIFOXYA1_FULL_40_18]|uniref:Uncharacterized protein n=4 Tax=Candidatus Woeseibacteriota TaxID=1752722 RepID=A0A0G0SM93_9BACT|nr:MAG: hypothetical protein UU03_C0003G0018 [Candidatus Woesebacteria bacterium GW2011_GWA1_40_45]OGM75522.1 MAG: hypothetical protein A2210_00290 [Candidatus Woesebacteria bacterium RIFOXYA1_FULL_40_18]OGM81486.1 MAG: hypothetical protein A2361_02350 [Candidatus Woesebacteria bacterium RIFOXYB1_FULL_40_26]OGM86983.1 MAG: hypothetical protein A2614_01730 [Candidatus Woesebacteria bacterium RIFOXYD1_FULL_40_21]